MTKTEKTNEKKKWRESGFLSPQMSISAERNATMFPGLYTPLRPFIMAPILSFLTVFLGGVAGVSNNGRPISATKSPFALYLASASLLLSSPVVATSIVAGQFRTCATVQGNVACWGDGRFGAIGRGDTENWGDSFGEMSALVPIQFSNPTLGVKQVATVIDEPGTGFRDHTCVLFTNNQVFTEFFFSRNNTDFFFFL